MYFFLDFETTGLIKEGVTDFLVQPGISQVGIVVTDKDFNEIDSFASLINPEIPDSRWEAGAIKVTGIGPEKVQNEPTFFASFDKIASMALGCQYWGGYHTKFDKDILWHQLLRYGFERSFPWPPGDYDVMKFARSHMQMEGKRGTKNPKLVEIYEHLFKESFDAHDALEDIRATVRVAKELAR